MQTTTSARGNDESVCRHVSSLIEETSLGPVFIATTANGICCAAFADSTEEQQTLLGKFPNIGQSADATLRHRLQQAAQWIDSPTPGISIPLDIQGTPFQRSVWKALLEIPMGQTTTYAAIARRIGQPSAARAVARACAANSIAVLIPCHRVVRSDGELGGYRWGMARKENLLRRERGVTA